MNIYDFTVMAQDGRAVSLANGEKAITIYQWLTQETKFEGFGNSPMAEIRKQY